MSAIVKALRLPTTYRVVQRAQGHLLDKRRIEVAALHSGTGGHVGVFAKHIDGVWSEIAVNQYEALIHEIFHF